MSDNTIKLDVNFDEPEPEPTVGLTPLCGVVKIDVANGIQFFKIVFAQMTLKPGMPPTPSEDTSLWTEILIPQREALVAAITILGALADGGDKFSMRIMSLIKEGGMSWD
jgi:hypothetical protein